jgi:hypothetical protein
MTSDEPGVIYRCSNGVVTKEHRSEGHVVMPDELRDKLAAQSDSDGAMGFLRRVNRAFRRATA